MRAGSRTDPGPAGATEFVYVGHRPEVAAGIVTPALGTTAPDTRDEFPVLSAVEAGVGLTVLSAGQDRVRLRAPLVPGLLGPDRRLHPALLSAAADAGVGSAVFCHPAISPTGVTVELRVDHLAAVAPGARSLEVTAAAVAVTREFGTGRAELRDDLGTLVAHATGVMVGDTNSGRAQQPGIGPPSAPLNLASLDVVTRPDGSARVDIATDMLNIRGTVHGAVLMAVAHRAQEHCFRASGASLRPLRTSVSYLRPAPGAGFLDLESVFVRRGRRMWTLRTELRRPDGAIVAVATGAAEVVPAADSVLD